MKICLLTGFILLVLLLSAPPVVGQTSVVLTATDSKCIASVSNANWNDNRFRAYWSSPSQGFVDGFVKFDLSSIPDTATIVGLKMTTYHELGYSNPLNNPEVRCYRVSNDSWARGATNSHPGLNEVLTPIHTGFPSGDLVPWDWTLDVSAATWSVDLLDDTLTLALRNEAGSAGRYSYVYWYGSDPVPAPPILTVQYTGLSLTATGTCPGSMTFDVTGATLGGPVILGYALGTGSFVIPGSKPCAGTTLGLDNSVQLLTVLTADGSGKASLTRSVPAKACKKVYLQAVDRTTCDTSNVVPL